MLQTDFDPRANDSSHPSLRVCFETQKVPMPGVATLIAEKLDTASRHVRQIELLSQQTAA